MSYKSRISVLLLAVAVGVMLLVPPVQAATPVGKISAFSGDVAVLSGKKVLNVTQVGQVLNAGDRVQTKDGDAEIRFIDGAIMKVSPYTTTMIQEREEETGFWPFKTRQIVRRLTCFVGKLWFKSGGTVKNNYLQTPTAVAGLRGSEASVGYDNATSYLEMVSGELAVTYGTFVQGFFENPGVDAATKNQVYQALAQAAESGDVGAAEAAIVAAGMALVNNPDPTVSTEAQDVVENLTGRRPQAEPPSAAAGTTSVLTTTSSTTTTSSVETTTSPTAPSVPAAPNGLSPGQ
jgi:hypothetical protein